MSADKPLFPPPPMPRINLNGTDGNVLCREWQAAYDTLEAAIAALQDATLHGRDFQTHPVPSAYALAVASHHKRLRLLALVRDELLEIVLDLQRQLDERDFYIHGKGERT